MSKRDDSSKVEKEIRKGLRKTRISDRKTGGPSTSKDEFVKDVGTASDVSSGSKSDEKLKELAAALEPHMDEIEKMLNDFAKGEKRREFLETALLGDMKYHGMGLIKMLNETCEYFAKDWKVIKQWTLLTRSEQSWDRISKYMLKYENPENPQYSHPWARLFGPRYFADLNCERNVFLCGIFGVIVAEAQGHPGIWQSVWAKKNEAQLDVPKRIGAAMLKKYGVGSKEKKKERMKLKRALIVSLNKSKP